MNPILELLKALKESGELIVGIWDLVRKHPKPILVVLIASGIGWGYQWYTFDRPGWVIEKWIVGIGNKQYASALELVDPQYREARRWTVKRFERLFSTPKTITGITIDYQGSRWKLSQLFLQRDLRYETTYNVSEKLAREVVFDTDGNIRPDYAEVALWLQISDPARFIQLMEGSSEPMTLSRRFTQIFTVSKHGKKWLLSEIENHERTLLNPQDFY
jgi:hypothetical protein